jgi:hypothetical protein
MLRGIFFGVLLLGISAFAGAQAGLDELEVRRVAINEIAWMGSEVRGVDSRQWWRYEWVELYNLSGEDISLAGWTIVLERDELDFVIPLQGIIRAEEYVLVAASDKVEGVDVQYGSLAGKFANGGQAVRLQNSKGKTIELVDAQAGWFAGDNEEKLTMERRFPDRHANEAANWGSSVQSGGTPKAKNSIFEQEAVLDLGSGEEVFSGTKKGRSLPFLAGLAQYDIFRGAMILAASLGLLVVLLRRYLLAPPSEGSFDGRKD